VPTVDETLRVYRGRELQFIVAMVRKYGPDKPEPLVPCKPNKTADEIEFYRNRAKRLYQKYCPSRMASIDHTLSSYLDIEELMMETLVRKYGPEPAPDEQLPELTEQDMANQLPGSDASAVFSLPPVQGGEPLQVTPADLAAAAGGSQQQAGMEGGIASPSSNASAAAAGGGASGAGGGAAGLNLLTLEQQAQIQAAQQQSALAIVTDMETRLRGAYARLEEAHQRAESLRAENIKLHEHSTKVMQDNDVIAQELRRQLAEAAKLSDEIKASCDGEKERIQREHRIEIGVSTQKLQEELLRGEQAKLDHQRELGQLNARLCEAEEQKGETVVQTQYLRQRVAALEVETKEAAAKMDELKNRLKERDDVCHRGVQTGGDDTELRSELKQRKTAALRELESLGAEAQHWRSLASRLETELRAAERRRNEIEKTSKESLDAAGAALQQAKDLNFALEDRVAVLEAELLATPSSSTGTVSETELRARVVELQRELTDAQATIRGQRQQVNDLRGLLAMHMATPSSKLGSAVSVLSPARGSSAAASAKSSPSAAVASPSASARRTPQSGGSTLMRR
jgi:hypothetical protein